MKFFHMCMIRKTVIMYSFAFRSLLYVTKELFESINETVQLELLLCIINMLKEGYN